MLIILIILIIFSLFYNIYIDHQINETDKNENDIEKLKWPFLNIRDQDGKKVDIVCIRGPLTKKEDVDKLESFKKQKKLIIGCSSYLSFPLICKNPICNYDQFFFKGKRIDEICDGWAHPFKDHSEIRNKNKILLSESDFADTIKKVNNFDLSQKKNIYDFVCYCPSDPSCNKGWNHYNKNWSLAKKTIEVACNELGLKGILIGREKCKLDVNPSQLERHEKLPFIDFIKTLSNSRFTIISSYEDASPRVITESLMVDTPVLVYKNIIGGWKYVSEDSGLFYDETNIKNKIKLLLSKQFYPREYFLKNYGIKNSGKKFRDFIVNIDPSFSKYKYLRFSVS